MPSPTVSILLAVYDGARTLRRCLDSVAAQTQADLEIIVVDDASADNTLRLLQQWQADHPRVPLTILRNETNLGLTRSLLKGVAQSRGVFLARIDADDWWAPTKLAKQVAYLTAHPKVGVVGCWYKNIRPSGATTVRLPVTHEEIARAMFWRNPFGHSCVVIRKTLLERANYDPALRYGQDRDLWFRLLPLTRFHNLPEVLCSRTVDHTLSTTKTRQQVWQQFKTVHTYIQRYQVSPLAYLSFIEPFLLLLLPLAVRRALRSLYDHLLAD